MILDHRPVEDDGEACCAVSASILASRYWLGAFYCGGPDSVLPKTMLGGNDATAQVPGGFRRGILRRHHCDGCGPGRSADVPELSLRRRHQIHRRLLPI